jgi:transposase InsO family protein
VSAAAGLGASHIAQRTTNFIPPRPAFMRLARCGLYHRRTSILTCDLAWRKEYNEERPKRSLGGLTPAAYAKTLIKKPVKLTSDSKAQCY